MAGVKKEHWRTTQRNTQVDDTISKLYNEIKDKDLPKPSVTSIGDYLDKERQFHDGFSWNTVKGGNMTKKLLISKFFHYSRKTFTSRKIFLSLLEKWDPNSKFEMFGSSLSIKKKVDLKFFGSLQHF